MSAAFLCGVVGDGVCGMFVKTDEKEWVVSTSDELHKLIVSLFLAGLSPLNYDICIWHTRGKGMSAPLPWDQLSYEDLPQKYNPNMMKTCLV